MGFLEVAAAMKFISNVDLIWNWGIFTRSFVLSIWIALGVILAVYLLGKFQLFHDTKPERIGAIRLLSAVLSLAISFYLLTGLFGAKLGELESFLPPDLENSSSKFFGGKSAEELSWINNDLEKAVAQAKSRKQKSLCRFYRLHLHELPLDGSECVSEKRSRGGNVEIRSRQTLHRRRRRSF